MSLIFFYSGKKSAFSLIGSCKPQSMFHTSNQTIGYFQRIPRSGVLCRNTEPIVNLQECSGLCGSTARYAEDLQGFQNSWQCCRPSKTHHRTVRLTCSDGSYLDQQFETPDACSCAQCSGGA